MVKKYEIERIQAFIKDNFESLDDYLKGVSRKGIIEELKLYNIDIWINSDLTTEDLREIYKIVMKRYKIAC